MSQFDIGFKAFPATFDLLNFQLVKIPSPRPKMMFTLESLKTMKCSYPRDNLANGKNTHLRTLICFYFIFQCVQGIVFAYDKNISDKFSGLIY